MTPFKDNGRLTAAQCHYNKKVSSVRQVVERTIGRLKNRFRRLKFIQCHTASDICDYIVAACILHNLCERSGGEVEFDFLEQDDEHHDFNQGEPVARATNERRDNLVAELWTRQQ